MGGMGIEQDNQEAPLCSPQIMIIIIRSTVLAKLREWCFFVEKKYFFFEAAEILHRGGGCFTLRQAAH